MTEAQIKGKCFLKINGSLYSLSIACKELISKVIQKLGAFCEAIRCVNSVYLRQSIMMFAF